MIETILALLAGLLIGSFLNVCIYRLPRLTNRSVVRPRSRCWRCRAPIAWYDNIPLLSYALLGGRCRQCRRRIPIRYPIVELATAVFFAVVVAYLGVTLPALKFGLLCAIFIALTATDFERHILPDEFTLGGLAAGPILAFFIPNEGYLISMLLPYSLGPRVLSFSEALFGAAVASGALWLIGYLYGKLRGVDALGFGDVKMIAMVGAFLGLRGALETMILGSLAGSIIGLIYIRVARKDWRSFYIPFGSFLGIAGLVIVVFRIRE